jgi:hypothetical protein
MITRLKSFRFKSFLDLKAEIKRRENVKLPEYQPE